MRGRGRGFAGLPDGAQTEDAFLLRREADGRNPLLGGFESAEADIPAVMAEDGSEE